MSACSPVKPHSYGYFYKHIQEDLLLGSITGVLLGYIVVKSSLYFVGYQWRVGMKMGENLCMVNLGDWFVLMAFIQAGIL